MEKSLNLKFEKSLTFSGLFMAIISALYIVFRFVHIIARGAAFAVFVIFILLCGLISAFLGIYLWLKHGKGFQSARQFVKVMFLLVLVVGVVFTFQEFQERKNYHRLMVDGVERQYLLHVPAEYDGETPMPLLLALHGGSGNARQFQRQTHFDEVAEKYNFIVVYPDGLGLTKYNFHVWNSGHIQMALDRGYNDVGFIIALIQVLKENYKINASQVYITGHSNGGMMTYRMAAEHPELFAAAAPVAGSIGGKATPESDQWVIPKASEPVSIIHIHGKQDINVVYDGGFSESGYTPGQRYDISAKDSVAFWVDIDNCTQEPSTEFSKNKKIQLDRYGEGLNNTEVLLVTFLEQNHFWENLNTELVNEGFIGSSLAEMIWLILSNYKKV